MREISDLYKLREIVGDLPPISGQAALLRELTDNIHFLEIHKGTEALVEIYYRDKKPRVDRMIRAVAEKQKEMEERKQMKGYKPPYAHKENP